MTSSRYGNLTVVALLVAVVGIVVQIISGVDYPTVPPGIIILVAAAALVAFAPWRWTPLVGVAVGVFLLVGFVLSGVISELLDPTQPVVFVGTWIQFLAVLVAVATGAAATIRNYGVKGA